jgi:glutathione S-transferase
LRYELYYWPSIPGRGEFVRLALEEAGADYVDVARERGEGKGIPAMVRMIEDKGAVHRPYAPPFLKAGRLVVAQTANILLYLGEKHELAPANEAGRLWANQLQLTIADLVDEAHDTHHPIANSLYYEDQKQEAKRRSELFLKNRVPKYLGYFAAALDANGGSYLAGRRVSYPDLSLFHVVAGLTYAFPNAMAREIKKHKSIAALAERVAARPRIKAYLASPRRLPFNESGVFRHYPELDSER